MQLFYPEQPSVLQAEMIVAWKRSRGLYNFDMLPDIAVVCVDYHLVRQFAGFGTKKLKGLKGKNFIKKGVVFCSGFDNGASGIFTLLEELRALGVKQFVFFGFAGAITTKVAEGEIYVIEKAMSASMVTGYYSNNTVLEPYDTTFFDKIKSDLNVGTRACFSIDTPFRETRDLIEDVARQGATLIEMECAAVYAFGQFYQLNCVCFLVAADNLIEGWKAPQNFESVQQNCKRFLNNLKQYLDKK